MFLPCFETAFICITINMYASLGIAEVLLPIDHRIGVIRDTQEAVIQKMNDHHARIPSGSGTEKRKEILESLLPKNFNTGPSTRRCLGSSRIEDPGFEFNSTINPVFPFETSLFFFVNWG